jgi:hypothetical protein
MPGPNDIIPEWLYNSGAIALATSSVLTAIAYAIAASRKALARKAAAQVHAEVAKKQAANSAVGRVTTHDAAPKLPPASATLARNQFLKRLTDAREAYAAEKSSARSTKTVSNILIFVQVIVGGVLATSFVQHQDPTIVALLGIVVLVATLVRQAYHPEVNAQQSKLKSAKLLGVIRASEDELVAVDAKSTKGEDRTDTLIAMTAELTKKLNEVENSDQITTALAARTSPGKSAS